MEVFLLHKLGWRNGYYVSTSKPHWTKKCQCRSYPQVITYDAKLPYLITSLPYRYNECDDFFKLVVACHIVAAAMKELKMQDMSDVPTFSGISDEDTIDLWMEDEEQRKTLLKCVSDEIVDKYISFQYHAKLQSSKDKVSCKIIYDSFNLLLFISRFWIMGGGC